MDGENNGKPYFQMDDLGGFPIIFGNTHIDYTKLYQNHYIRSNITTPRKSLLSPTWTGEASSRSRPSPLLVQAELRDEGGVIIQTSILNDELLNYISTNTTFIYIIYTIFFAICYVHDMSYVFWYRCLIPLVARCHPLLSIYMALRIDKKKSTYTQQKAAKQLITRSWLHLGLHSPWEESVNMLYTCHFWMVNLRCNHLLEIGCFPQEPAERNIACGSGHEWLLDGATRSNSWIN